MTSKAVSEALPDALKAVGDVMCGRLESSFHDCMKEFLRKCQTCFPSERAGITIALNMYDSYAKSGDVISTFYELTKSHDAKIMDSHPDIAHLLKAFMADGVLAVLGLNFHDMFVKSPPQTQQSILAYVKELYMIAKAIVQGRVATTGTPDELKTALSGMVGMDLNTFIDKAAASLYTQLESSPGKRSPDQMLSMSMETVMKMMGSKPAST